MSIDAMKQALEALERGETKLRYEAITALRDRLAQPERQWQGLTEAEKVNVAISCGCADVAWIDFADAIEANLRERNA